MKKIWLLMGLMMALLAAPTFAQVQSDLQTHNHGICGTTYEQGLQIKERLLNNRKDGISPRNRDVTTYVPVKIHLVADLDGSGRMSESNALDMLCILNQEWEPLDIQFYLKDGFNYINNTLINNHSVDQSIVWGQSAQHKANNAINIFVTKSVGGSSQGGGITLAYYIEGFNYQYDNIYIKQSEVYGANVLPHEVGHFFSLNHPFFGWESAPWDENEHGLQVGTFSPGGNFNEKVNDPNCENDNVADAICDTPPDYLFGFGQSGCGQWNQGTMDPDGVVIDPMENNTMSYFSSCPQYEFTPQQEEAIYDDLLGNNNRNYVNPGITPNLTEITDLPVLTSPINQMEMPYNAIELNWDPVEGATHYLVEWDRFSSFSVVPERKVVDTNSAFISAVPNANYFWRVRPFGEYRTCMPYSEAQTFKTNAIASGVSNVEGLNHWIIRPNPVNGSNAIFIEMETTQSMDATINVYSTTGQLLSSDAQSVIEGANTIEVNINDLAAGLYLVSIQTETGVTTKRLVVR